jgi:hypothetical protein
MEGFGKQETAPAQETRESKIENAERIVSLEYKDRLSNTAVLERIIKNPYFRDVSERIN